MSRKTKKDLTKELAEELDAFDNMLTSLVELLEEKGILTQEEWEKRIKAKIGKNRHFLNYRNVQFKKGKKQ